MGVGPSTNTQMQIFTLCLESCFNFLLKKDLGHTTDMRFESLSSADNSSKKYTQVGTKSFKKYVYKVESMSINKLMIKPIYNIVATLPTYFVVLSFNIFICQTFKLHYSVLMNFTTELQTLVKAGDEGLGSPLVSVSVSSSHVPL